MSRRHYTDPRSSSSAGSFNSDDPNRPRWDRTTQLLARFEYHNADGTHAYYVDKGRTAGGEKVFRVRRANLIPFSDRLEIEDKCDEFVGLGDQQQWVLYRLPHLIAAPSDALVYIVEGEKDAESVAALGHIATTNPCGALKWRDEFSEYLRGRDVAIIPDNDERGRRHASQVLQSVHGKARSVRIVNLPGLPPKGDVTDWLRTRRVLP